MKAILFTLAVVLVPALGAANPKQVIVSSPVYACDGAPHVVSTWTATVTSKIVDVLVWIGTDSAIGRTPFQPVDVFTTVFSSHEPGFVLSYFGRDAYAPPTGIHQLDKAFPENQAVTLAPGQQIGVTHQCTPVGGSTSHSQTLVIVTYQETP